MPKFFFLVYFCNKFCFTMLNLTQSLKQIQKLSPQQIQLIKLLEIPTIQLEQRIKREIEENPVLEEGGSEDRLDEARRPGRAEGRLLVLRSRRRAARRVGLLPGRRRARVRRSGHGRPPGGDPRASPRTPKRRGLSRRRPRVARRIDGQLDHLARGGKWRAFPCASRQVTIRYFDSSKFFVVILTTEYTEMHFVRHGRRLPKGSLRIFQPQSFHPSFTAPQIRGRPRTFHPKQFRSSFIAQ